MTGSPEPYQLLPELPPEAFASLKADIAARGVLVPVEVDEAGAIVDGHHRVRAWSELRAEGVRVPDYPRVVRRFASEQEKFTHALRLNLTRRHLDQAGRRVLAGELRRRGLSLRVIGDALGIDASTVGRSLQGVADATPELVRGRDGKRYPARRPEAPALFVQGGRDEKRALAALAALPEGARSPSNLLRAEERARSAALARRRAEQVPPRSTGRAWEVRSGDFREVLGDLPDHSVDAIVTDPPYNAAGVALLDDLGAFAARVLKPGRLLACYVGKLAFDDEIAALGRHLSWVWCGAVFLPGRHVQIRSRMIRTRWRPVLLFSKGPYEPRGWLLDSTTSEGRGEKGVEDHHWQQTTGPFVRWVEQLTRPGELVVDPFVGGGTTGLACLCTGRRFVGSDLDKGAVSLTVERLEAAEGGERPGGEHEKDEPA